MTAYAALSVVGVSSVLFIGAALFATVPLAPVPAFIAGYQSALAINDLHHGHPAVFAVRHRAFAGAAAARQRISVHRGGSGCSRPDLSGSVRPGRASQCRPADDGLALPDLARRFPASGARLCTAEGQRWRRRKYGDRPASAILGSVAAVGVAISFAAWIVTARHDILPVMISGGHFTSTLIGTLSTEVLLSFAALMVLWFRRPHSVLDVWLMVVTMRLDVRHRAVGDIQRGQIRSGLLCRPVLRALRRQLRTGGALDRQRRPCRASWPACSTDCAGRRLPSASHHTERERLFSAVVESSNDAIITQSLDGTITALEPGRRAAVRLHFDRSGRQTHRHPGPAGPARRRFAEILEQVGRGEADQGLRNRAHTQGRPRRRCVAVRLADPIGRRAKSSALP